MRKLYLRSDEEKPAYKINEIKAFSHQNIYESRLYDDDTSKTFNSHSHIVDQPEA